jgi:hypothetical protein
VHLLRARSDFRQAQDRLAIFVPLVTRLAWVPSVGDEIAASPAAARLATQATEGSLSMLDGLHSLIGDFGRKSRHVHVSTTVALQDIAGGRADFAQACDYFSDAGKTRAELVGYRSPQVTTPLRTFDRELPQLRVACRALVLLPAILGLHHPYTYLVAYQNPAEIRASGGFIGSVGLLTLHNGRASQHFMSTKLRDNLSLPPPEPIAVYNDEPGWLLRDSNWSPDFPTTAALERFFARLDLRWNAPGVIDITPQATADALAATGPFYSPEYHRWITSQNVAFLTDYFTHYTAQYGPLRIANEDTRRKQFIEIVARHLFARFASLEPAALIRLARAVGDDLTRGNISINFLDRDKQRLIELAGATGQLKHDSSDFLYIVDSNLSYNKVNPYVHISVDYRVHILRNRWLQANLALRFQNSRAPWYVYTDASGPGAGRTGAPADYSDFVRIYVPAGAALNDQSGWLQPWSPGLAYGKTMFSGYLIVPVSHTRVVHLSYIVPPNVFSWSRGHKYRLLIQHQSGSNVDSFHVTVSADGRSIVRRSFDHANADATVSASIEPRAFQPIALSKNPAPMVAPGHWIEPYAYLGQPKP